MAALTGCAVVAGLARWATADFAGWAAVASGRARWATVGVAVASGPVGGGGIWSVALAEVAYQWLAAVNARGEQRQAAHSARGGWTAAVRQVLRRMRQRHQWPIAQAEVEAWAVVGMGGIVGEGEHQTGEERRTGEQQRASRYPCRRRNAHQAFVTLRDRTICGRYQGIDMVAFPDMDDDCGNVSLTGRLIRKGDVVAFRDSRRRR